MWRPTPFLLKSELFFELLNDFNVCRKPIDIPQVIGIKPFHILVSVLFELPRKDGSQVAPHRQVKRRVIVFNRAKIVEVTDRDLELFLNLAHDRLLAALARLEFATRKLPAVFKLALAALAAQDLPVFLNNRCCNID